MGFFDDLFGGKNARLAAEEEVMRKLAQAQILEELIDMIMTSEEYAWIYKEQGSKDRRNRQVVLTEKGICFKWRDVDYVRDASGKQKKVENVLEHVYFDFYDSGYAPLSSFPYGSGAKEVPVWRVCGIFGQLVRERIAAKIPKASFGDVIDLSYETRFKYKLPGRELKNII